MMMVHEKKKHRIYCKILLPLLNIIDLLISQHLLFTTTRNEWVVGEEGWNG